MREYNPDRWVLIETRLTFKVLAGFSGGYLDSDYWKLSSGVVDIEVDGDYYLFKNHSGSVYKCHKKAEGFTILSGQVCASFEKAAESAGEQFEIVGKINIEEILKKVKEKDEENG